MKRKVSALALLALLVLPALLSQRAFADGLFQENLPPATIGDRQAVLFVKINPPVLTSDTIQDAFVQFRLYNANNNETIKFTTFVITVTKGMDPDAKPILTDAFHTESGLLTLKIQPREGPVTIFATQEDFLKAWKADPGGTINIQGPILLEGGLYHFRMELLTVDNIRNLFAPDKVPVFDAYLSVGDVYSKDIEFEGRTYPTTVISYYDRVSGLSFDGNTKTYSWSMPFDWDYKRLNATANIFVHEEIKIPKSLEGVGDQFSFAAKVNGMPLASRMILADPYASESELQLHLLMSKNDVLDFAERAPEGASAMEFEVSPGTAASQTSGNILTDNGGMNVRLNWTPSQLGAEEEATLNLEFRDPSSDRRVNADVLYDLAFYDAGGDEVYAVKNQLAKAGVGSQAVTFPVDDDYHIAVTVKALQTASGSQDTSRNGIARGVVVVPEFPSGALIATAAVLGALVLFQRLKTRK